METTPLREDEKALSSAKVKVVKSANVNVARRRIVIEPAFLAYCFVVSGSGPIVEQYLYARFKEKYPSLISANNVTFSHCDVNISDPLYIDTESVQAETSRWLSNLDLGRAIFQLLPTFLLGAYSDATGRRVVLLLPCLASAVKMATVFVIINFKLHVDYMLIGEICEGLSGGLVTMKTIAICYLADTTTADKRAMRITILCACQTVANAGSRIAVGYFIKEQGFMYTTLTFGFIQIINLTYLFMFVPETIDPNPNHIAIIQLLRRTLGVFTKKENKRQIKLLLLTAMNFVYVMPLGGHSLQILFVLNMPFCWGPIMIGIYGAVSALGTQLTGLAGLKILKVTHVSDMWIAALGAVSGIGGCLMNAWASADLMMYLVSIFSLLMVLPSPIIRSTISCLLNPDEQGTVLSGVACVEVVSYLSLFLLVNVIYQHTLFFMPGFAFVVCAGFGGITLTLILTYIYLTRIEDRKKEKTSNTHAGV